jgi:hypothetical protein
LSLLLMKPPSEPWATGNLMPSSYVFTHKPAPSLQTSAGTCYTMVNTLSPLQSTSMKTRTSSQSRPHSTTWLTLSPLPTSNAWSLLHLNPNHTFHLPPVTLPTQKDPPHNEIHCRNYKRRSPERWQDRDSRAFLQTVSKHFPGSQMVPPAPVWVWWWETGGCRAVYCHLILLIDVGLTENCERMYQ